MKIAVDKLTVSSLWGPNCETDINSKKNICTFDTKGPSYKNVVFKIQNESLFPWLMHFSNEVKSSSIKIKVILRWWQDVYFLCTIYFIGLPSEH